MRLSVLLFLLLFPTFACAQHTDLHTCIDKLAADSRFAPLASKLDLGGHKRSSATLDDSSLATPAEIRILKTWIAARGVCLQTAEQEGNAVYRPPLTAIAIDTERRTIAEATALAERKISFADFSRRREAIEEDKQRKAASVNRRIQDQSSAFEADQRTRELQQIQRDAQEAERQANLAQQRLGEMEARRANRRYVQPQPAVPAPTDPYPYRTCFNRGTRVVCTR